MIAASLFSWWYGAGWRHIRTDTKRRIASVTASFSVPSLLKTLFAPWRRIYTDPGNSIQERFRAMEDNFVSRFIGFFIRVSVLIAAGVMIGGIALLGLLQIILWPLVPALIVGCLVWSVL